MTAESTGGPRESTPREELWLYLFAALSYIAAGFLVKQIFAWWWFGAVWFVGFVWLVPRLGETWRHRRGSDSVVEEAK